MGSPKIRLGQRVLIEVDVVRLYPEVGKAVVRTSGGWWPVEPVDALRPMPPTPPAVVPYRSPEQQRAYGRALAVQWKTWRPGKGDSVLLHAWEGETSGLALHEKMFPFVGQTAEVLRVDHDGTAEVWFDDEWWWWPISAMEPVSGGPSHG